MRDTALVCKRWSALCLDNPPQHRDSSITLHPLVGSTFLHWMAKCGKRTESITIDIKCERDDLLPRALLCQTLTIIAPAYPKLRRLEIVFPGCWGLDRTFFESQGYCWNNFADCLPLFRQLDHLQLLGIKFRSGEADGEQWGQGGARSLVPQNFFQGMTLQVSTPARLLRSCL